MFEDTDLVSGATRNLNLLLLPGDLSFKIAGLKTKFYWDFSYNIEGSERVQDIYRLGDHRSDDDVAFLAGVQFGENEKGGDWSVLMSYRRTGIGAVDPNLNDSTFAQGELNTQGFEWELTYNLTDFAALLLPTSTHGRSAISKVVKRPRIMRLRTPTTFRYCKST